MSARVQRLRLRLFIEGVEVPCISAQVQVSPNSPLVASIQIPPLSEGMRFLPRSLVHLFFLDLYDQDSPNVRLTGSSIHQNPGPTVYERLRKAKDSANDAAVDATNELVRDVEAQRYKLLFVGEQVGHAWSKSAVNRSLILQCADLSNYWDYAYQFENSDIFGPGLKAMFSGGATNLFTDFLSDSGSIIVKLLHEKSTQYPALRGLLGGIVHVLESIGGSYYYDKKYAGQNIFFSLAELRLHITQLITAFDQDPTAKKLLGGEYDALFGRSIGNLGDQASFRKVINALISVIFHETYGQPCPYYQPGKGGSVSGFERKKAQSVPTFAPFVLAAQELESALVSIIVELGSDTIFSTLDLIQRLNASKSSCNRNARAVTTAVRGNRSGDSLGALGQQISAAFSSAATSIGKAISKTKAATSKAANSPARKELSDLLSDARTQLLNLSKLEANVTATKNAIPARLNQQIFRPDVWFSAPPRCNVLFPDQYMSLSYSRSFLSEPTRLLLKTNDEFFGEDELFDNFYFAPKALTLKEEKNQLSSLLRGDILDHELFTGILPVFEKMGEFNIFAARSGMVDGKTPKVGLAQRSTNFLYFKYRFASRQLQITGRFNPYIACGFPGLIIDKYVDLQTFKLHNELIKSLPNAGQYPPRSLSKMLGTHFLGNFTEVTHNVDQQQGTTLINCSYARQPEESVEFLGSIQTEVEVMKKSPGKGATRVTTVAALIPPRAGMQGPNGGRILHSVNVTSKWSTQTLPLFNGAIDRRTQNATTRVVVGIPQQAVDFGKEVVDLAGDPAIVVQFDAYELSEELQRMTKQKIDLPPEEYIRPGWYGDCWHPSKISEPYYQFFNTGAITEPTQAQSALGEGQFAPQVVTSNDAVSALRGLQTGDTDTFTKDQLISLSLLKDSNIEQAVSYLVLVYSSMKQAGFDIEEFIKSYTWRPIATMLDMFGSSDLQIDPSGKDVVRGIEGFHSRAFGPYEDLFGLVTGDIESIVGIKRGSTVAKKADTRKRKYNAVLDYVAAIRLSRAILG